MFVEGDEDIDLLNAGFPDLLAGYQLKSLGGRTEVEKDISRLQAAESRGEVERLSSFIFDRDRKPASIGSTRLVKVLQWDRYCIESYLTDETVLFDVLQRYCQTKPESKGMLRASLKEMALAQTGDEAIRRAYANREPENCGLRPKEVFSKSATEAADLLYARLERAQQSLATLKRDEWTREFAREVEQTAAALRADWDDTWRKECDAKRLFRDLQAKYQAKVSLGFLKAEVIKEMRTRQSDDWKVLQTLIRDAISQPA